MISVFRRSLNTWAARGFFMLMVAAFVTWGVGDVVRNMGHTSWVAKVGDRTIEPPVLQEAYQRQLAQVLRLFGQPIDPTPEIKRGVLGQALDRLITQLVVGEEQARLGIVVPVNALRQAIYDIPAFKNPAGQFDHVRFEAYLRQNNLTEPRVLQGLGVELSTRQLLEAVRAGVGPSDFLARQVFAFQSQKRSADMVELPFASAAAPAPDDAALHRWYDNHPDLYSTPEYRRIKAVILSPQSVARDIPITDDELRTVYEQHRSEYNKPEKRSAQIILTQDPAKAQALAQEWRSGADWTRMQQAAKDAGATAVEVEDTAQQAFPDPGLARAVFEAQPNAVSDPAQDALQWRIVKVTKVAPGETRSFEDVRDQLRERVLAEKAADLIYDRANKIDNLLGGGAALEELPTDLGLVAVTGTLDAQGNNLAGAPAPIPGAPELRAAIIQGAFQTQKGDPPRSTEVPLPGGGAAYYVLKVEDVLPPAPKPYDDIAEQVRSEWERDARRHAQEQAAAKVLAAVQAGQSLQDAATVAGLTVRRTALTGRTEPAEGVPRELMEPLFRARAGEPVMVETPEAFLVAVPAEVVAPEPTAAQADYDRIRSELGAALADDFEKVYLNALRQRARPQVNTPLLDSMIQR